MADGKARNKRRQRARNKRASRAGQTGTRGLTRSIGLALGGVVALAAIVGAVLFFANDSKDTPEAQTGEAGSFARTSSDLSSAVPTIGTTVGYRVPDISMVLNNGNTVSTGSLVREGKPTFLFFFATW